MNENHKKMVHREVRILNEVIDVLLKPSKYGISDDELFTYLNKFTTSQSDKPESRDQKISTQLINFTRILDLGRLLALKDTAPFADLQKLLSTNVYINHLPDTSGFSGKETGKSSTSTYYMPDLRLPIKNVIILFINYFKKQEVALSSQKPQVEQSQGAAPSIYDTSCKEMRSVMLLLNVSIINKLVKIFKTLNPKFILKSEALMVNI